MKPPLRTRRARGSPSRPERGSTPAHRFYRFGKHYRAGLQASERVSNVRIQGSEVSGQSVEQCPCGQAAKSVSGDEGCSMAATRKRRPQLVDFKHEGASGWPRTHLSRRPRRAAEPRHPPGINRFAIGAAAACLLRWLGPGDSRTKAPGAGIAPALRGRHGFAARRPSQLPRSRPSRIPSVRWRGHLRGRALKDS
jgi:hypothetical protein